MGSDALAELTFTVLAAKNALKSSRDHLHDIVESRLVNDPDTAAFWAGYAAGGQVSPELTAALAGKLRQDERFAARVEGLVNRAMWRRRLVPRRDVLLGIGLAVAGGVTGAVSAPFGEPRAQDHVKQAEEEKARSKGVLAAKVERQVRVDDALGWVFADPLSDAQVRDLPATKGRPVPGPLVGVARPVYIPLNSFGKLYNFTRARVTVVNHWPKPVLITDVRAKVKRTAPLSGALVWAGAQGGVPVIDLTFDLEEDEPRARTVDADGTLGDPWTYSENVELEPGQTQPFNVDGRATASCCEWYLEIHAEIGGEKQVFEAREAAGPFTTTAFADHYRQRFSYQVNGGTWIERGEGGMFR
ncbi:hypothetical protein ABZ816_23725 [Actinosynnema sp. NPDC047251]|uniref:Uncharacterized protein n=1 Tax=Saccharothrix espanaensis (strain ATCC 51144 / DSM 44229 / JCM 9112 / NBRC 15066 / NRRL 15764) TaxID=1179773 RepID=K0K6I8_SACES|nr:hypothetical protein [Saccharothrix espanaensis]CCH32519.1 hypothetical protein BN6_52550 [Saccharothrix espanaensis DSM 44229]